MAVYEGVLTTISGGEVISSEGTGGYWTHHGWNSKYRKTGVDQQAGSTRREFVDIGGTRIKSVILTPYYDQLLQEAVGEEIAVSMIGPAPSSSKRHTVVAMRTPKGGLNRPSQTELFRASTGLLFRHGVAMVVIFGILTFISVKILGSVGWLLGAAWVILWTISFSRSIRESYRAAAAL